MALEIEGCAKIADHEVTRRAVPADDVQQAFAYRHLVPTKELRGWVAGSLATSGSVRILTATPMKIPAGGVARVQIAALIGEKADHTTLELTDPPFGIQMKVVSITPPRVPRSNSPPMLIASSPARAAA